MGLSERGESASKYWGAHKSTEKRKDYGKRVNELLDAAFNVLQHDTGESDPEWHEQREDLAERFKKILRRKCQSCKKTKIVTRRKLFLNEDDAYSGENSYYMYLCRKCERSLVSKP